MSRFVAFMFSTAFVFLNDPSTMTQTKCIASNIPVTLMQNSQKAIYDNIRDPFFCIEEIGHYSPTVKRELNGDFKGNYDANDYRAIIKAIITIRTEFQQWDTFSLDERKELEIAHQYAMRLLSITFEHTNDLDVKQNVFLFFDESFNTDGKHLPSLLREIPLDYLTISKGGTTRTHITSFFLTDNLWKLLERSNDPVVISGIIALVYRTDSGTGYVEVNKKGKKIMAKSELSDEDKIILFNITQLNSYQQYTIQARENPNFNIALVQIAPPTVQLHWEIEEFGPKKPALKAEQLFSTKNNDVNRGTSENDPNLLPQPASPKPFSLPTLNAPE